MNDLNIGTRADGTLFRLPLEIVTTSLAILAKKRVGKSYTAAVMAEELMTAGQPVVIVDITGAHWGLKSSADGKKPMFPVAIFGGKHADVPLEDNAGAVVARAIVEKRFSAILDFSIMTKAAMKRFLLSFMEELYRINELPIHLICDEADRYAPQKPDADDAKLIAAMDDIVSRGGIKGIGVSLITQRSAKLNKNILTQCELLIALKIMHPLDVKAVMDWVELHAEPTAAAEMLKSLPTLPVGTGWFWWPDEGERNIFQRVKVRQRATFDSGATPKVGAVRAQPKQLAQVDLKALGEAIAATVQRAKENDPAALRAEIARLKTQLQQTAALQLRAELAHPKPALTLEQVQQMAALEQQTIAARAVIVEATEKMRKIEEGVTALMSEVRKKEASAHFAAKHPPALVMHATRTPTQAIRAGRDTLARPTLARQSFHPASNGGGPSSPQRKLLTILAQNPDGCVIEKLALLGGYRIGGGFRNLFSQMRAQGWINGENTGTMTITEIGRDALGVFEPLPTGSALGRHWLNSGRLGKAEKLILSLLLETPAGLTLEEIADRLGYAVGGGFRNLFSHLRTAGVIVGANTERMSAHPDLFD